MTEAQIEAEIQQRLESGEDVAVVMQAASEAGVAVSASQIATVMVVKMGKDANTVTAKLQAAGLSANDVQGAVFAATAALAQANPSAAGGAPGAGGDQGNTGGGAPAGGLATGGRGNTFGATPTATFGGGGGGAVSPS